MKSFAFTMTTGRSGTKFLAELVKANVHSAEVHHEILGWDRFGVDTPDVSHMTLFNSQGNVPKVQDFWRQKLSRIAQTSSDLYIECSHLLMKCGLVENLELLRSYGHVHLIEIRRDLFDTVMSFIRRSDFLNAGNRWMWYLDPAYPNNLVKVTGKFTSVEQICVWYVLEIRARSTYYRKLYQNDESKSFHSIDFEEMTSRDGANRILRLLNIEIRNEDVVVPAPQNTSRNTEDIPVNVTNGVRAAIDIAKAVDLDAVVDNRLRSRAQQRSTSAAARGSERHDA